MCNKMYYIYRFDDCVYVRTSKYDFGSCTEIPIPDYELGEDEHFVFNKEINNWVVVRIFDAINYSDNGQCESIRK